MVKAQISILITLAAKDGLIDDKELSLIHTIGNSHGLSEIEIKELLDGPRTHENLDDLNHEERFDCLYNLVHLMKVDGKIFDEEIDYCLKMAKKLQYPLEAVMDLYSLVHANVKLTHEITTLKKKYSTH